MTAAEPAAPSTAGDELARKFVQEHEVDVRPLEKTLSLAWWNANTTGKDEDFAAKDEAQNKFDAALAESRSASPS